MGIDYAQHGQHDASGRAGVAERPDTAGIPPQISSQVLVCPFNDLQSVEKLVAEFGSDRRDLVEPYNAPSCRRRASSRAPRHVTASAPC
jgi:glutamate-1-semialdehyde aminotransferase